MNGSNKLSTLFTIWNENSKLWTTMNSLITCTDSLECRSLPESQMSQLKLSRDGRVELECRTEARASLSVERELKDPRL